MPRATCSYCNERPVDAYVKLDDENVSKPMCSTCIRRHLSLRRKK